MINVKVLAGTLTVAAVGAAGLVWAYWHRGVTVIVRNTDSGPLIDVTVHVTGADYAIGDIASGSSRQVLVAPTGASHVEISHRAADGRERIPVTCYFEAGDSGTIHVELSGTSATVVDNQISVGLL